MKKYHANVIVKVVDELAIHMVGLILPLSLPLLTNMISLVRSFFFFSLSLSTLWASIYRMNDLSWKVNQIEYALFIGESSQRIDDDRSSSTTKLGHTEQISMSSQTLHPTTIRHLESQTLERKPSALSHTLIA